MGIEGAAIATLTGYVISDVICIIVLCKMKLHIMNVRFLILTFIMLIYIITWRLFFTENTLIGLSAAVVCSVFMIMCYRKDICRVLESAK